MSGIARVTVVVAALALAGCNGGTVDKQALTNDSSTLDSIACEGSLLAHDVARGRTTKFFAREQAEELRIQSSNFADALSRAKSTAADRAKGTPDGEESGEARVGAPAAARPSDQPNRRLRG